MKKNNIVRDFFSKDLHIKIFSLIVAIIAWFFVMNTITPVETKIFSAPVRFENTKALMEQGYIISNIDSFENQYVEIGVEATRPSLDELSKENNKNAIYANVDLSNINVNENESFPQTFLLRVEPTLPSYLYAHAYTVANYSPSYISVEIDRMLSKDMTLEIDTTGSVASDYEISSIASDVETVTVNGPASLMNDISKVSATVDVSKATKNMKLVAAPKVYDKAGNELKDFVVEPEKVSVNVYIHKKDTVNIDEPETTGVLPPYLKLNSIDWSPKSVMVTGNEENVSALEHITLDPVDLSKITESTTITYDISSVIEKAGLQLKNPNDKNINIKISLELVNPKEITIKSSDIKVTGLPANKTIELPEQTTIDVSGNNHITVQMLNPAVDVTGLSDGSHEVKLNLTAPQGTAIKNNIMINVVIESNEAPAEETNTQTETTTAEVKTQENIEQTDDAKENEN